MTELSPVICEHQVVSGSSNSKANLQVPFVTGLRGLVCLYVVAHHAWLQVFPVFTDSVVIGPVYQLTAWLLYGRFGVDIFIVLSGFCLALPVMRNGTRMAQTSLSFFRHRVVRIVPPYYVAILISVLLATTLIGSKIGTHYDCCLPVRRLGIVYEMAMIPELYATPATANHALWSIGVEFKIYFLFPLLVFFWSKFGKLKVAVTTLVLGLLASLALANNPWVGLTPHFLGLFTLGMLAADAVVSKTKYLASASLIATGIVSSITLFLMAQRLGTSLFPYYPYLDTLVGVIAASSIVLISRQPNGPVGRILSAPWLCWVGTVSYSLYLIHAPFLQLFSKYVAKPMHLSLVAELFFTLTLGVLLVFLCSNFFFFLFEQPFLKKRTYL
ncbi:MAG: acyltransferase [Candidatus Obscuribacterales bacterium]|nr:acyltransferase [Candidatus Obscuribacterales bacterium]